MKINELDRRNDLMKATYYVKELLKTKFKCSDYQRWIDIGLALASLGEDGRSLFHQVAGTSKKYDKIENDEKFDALLNGRNGQKNLGSFIRLCVDVYKVPKFVASKNRKQNAGHDDELKARIQEMVFLTRSVCSDSRFAHVFVDQNNIAYYFESTASGKASEPLLKKLALELGLNEWPKFPNEWLSEFDSNWIQRDTATECYLYFLNGTLRVTKHKVTFIPASKRSIIWASHVLQRNYKQSKLTHELARLAQKATVNYDALRIALGYLLHRHWFRNAAKVVWAVDHNPKSNHDGRRGKDLFTTCVSLARESVSVKWKAGSTFWTSSIKPDTAIIHFEDVDNRLSIDPEMKKTVTGDLSIEHKGANIVTRKFNDKPKISVSSQAYPFDYMDASIRGRIWLVEFTDYLQKNPPKKTLLYEDDDLAPFDAWMIECIQFYFKNIHKLSRPSTLTDDQKNESLKLKYGSMMLDAVSEVSAIIKQKKFCPTTEILFALHCEKLDGKLLQRFRDCYAQATGKPLESDRQTFNHVPRVRGFREKM